MLGKQGPPTEMLHRSTGAVISGVVEQRFANTAPAKRPDGEGSPDQQVFAERCVKTEQWEHHDLGTDSICAAEDNVGECLV